MGSFVSLQTDISGALRKFELTRTQANAAISRALNKTATTAKAQSAREIKAAGYGAGMKISDIKKSIRIYKATRSQLESVLRATGKPIPLINFMTGKWSHKSTGVTVKVKGSSKLIAGAFVATMPGGHKGIFVRLDSATHARLLARNGIKAYRGPRKSVYKHGLPIRELFGPSIPSAFKNDVVQAAVVDAIRDRFPTVLAQELRFVSLQ